MMERAFSVDDLVGGIFRLTGGQAGGFSRNDSESAFQEFLKRIPSATNLAPPPQPAATTTSQAFEPAATQPYTYTSSAAVPASLPISASDANPAFPGMPRVPSLDVLRQLVMQNQHIGFSQPKEEPCPVPTISTPLPSLSVPPAVDPAALSALSSVPGLSAAAAAAAAAANPSLLAAAVNPAAAAAAAAAAIQLQQLAPLRLGNSSGAEKGESYDKSESRRQRRMLSNRESARRSRKRKQEHMHTLEAQIAELNDISKEKEAVAEMAERRCHSLEDENQRLREENERLRDELQFLRSELTERKERNGFYGSNRVQERGQEQLLQHQQHEAETAAPAPASGGGRYKRQRLPNGHAAAAALAAAAAEAEAAAAAAAAAYNGYHSHAAADGGQHQQPVSPSSHDDDDDDNDDGDDGDDDDGDDGGSG